MDTLNIFFLVTALLLFVSVIVSRISARVGMPLLLAFLGVGMLAGEDGIGGIKFDSFTGATFVGQLALAIILLDGGLRTKFETFRIALKPASILASWGVLAGVGLLGIFATFYMGIDWKLGLLMAAIVGSTDAAAVFSLLRNSGVRLNARIQATLELESGINDPMAILLVSVLINLIMQPEATGFLFIVQMFVLQLGLGLLFGWLAGKTLAFILSQIRLAEGLYAILIASGGLLVFSITNLSGGSGFLAVYLAGVLIGNSRNSSVEHVLNVMDGLAWLAQAAMFLVLGLLVTPSRMLEHGMDALVIAGFLMLIARPLAVYSSIKWFHYSKKELAYISWVGLRGAVPITLAIMPLMMGVPNSRLLFDVAFAVVILSLLIQGTTIPYLANKLQVVLPPKPEPLSYREIWLARNLSVGLQSFKVAAGSEAENSHPYVMTRPEEFADSRLFALIRNGKPVQVSMNTRMQEDDTAWYILPEEKGDAFAEQFADLNDHTTEQQFYGEFILNPEVKVGDLAQVYGIAVKEDEAHLSLVDLFRARFGDIPVAGDRIMIDNFCITVKELDEQSYIKTFGLKIPKQQTDTTH
ncbi:potassium/proton antiporter [Neisseria wadsworthii]|uniref:potassium/proton antiporter n=1 Tax=Neisseria wadsworthii TaxID=607711 RepID=UPI000D31B2FD|nr:potassium/proton antiporter [Neisseria wadsworthii]